MQIPAVCFAGWSNAGKTTLIEKIVRRLSEQGIRTGVVKHSHHDITLDREGTDSDRYRAAGAAAVALASAEQTTLMVHSSQRLTGIMNSMQNMDIILVEGFDKEACLPTIEVYSDETQPMRSSVKWRRAVVTDLDCVTDVPVFRRNDEEGITGMVLALAAEQSAQEKSITVTINGQPLSIVPFVERMVENTLRGVLSGLDGYQDGCSIDVSIQSK